MTPEEVLTKGARNLSVTLSDSQIALFMRYLQLLKRWNKSINLTAITEDEDIVVSHFLDSISGAPFIEGCSNVLDIGTGGGFPGIPLKIISPDTNVTLLDSTNKKVAFLKEVIRELSLVDIKALWGRAEDIIDTVPRGGFDAVITRAVASIPDVIKLSAPYISASGRIVLMRGSEGESELEESGLARYGFRDGLILVRQDEISLPVGGQKRIILVFKRGA